MWTWRPTLLPLFLAAYAIIITVTFVATDDWLARQTVAIVLSGPVLI